jgi:5,10-methylenetetrahydrofolate reductase
MISLELVPHDMDNCLEEAQWAKKTFKQIDMINIPDILRLKIRSYDMAKQLCQQTINSIPHIRIIDFSEQALMALMDHLYQHGVKNVLLVSGDPPPNPLQPIFKHALPTIIEKIKTQTPNLTIFAACDPYRQNFQQEIKYCKDKLNAGASGLFTQPIFNPHLTELLIEQCLPCQWFIGISPVLTEKSFNYWVTRNNVVFSPTFKQTLDYNIELGKKILKQCKEANQHNYIMPIKTDIKSYLSGLLNDPI